MDGEVLEENDVPDLELATIQAVFDEFTGQIEQVPPMVSAVKVGGQRLYKLARKGETVERKPRQITVNEFVAIGYQPPLVHFRVSCTSGTYVRSLCHDAGAALGCGATLDSLRRTAVGRHNVADAAPLDQLQQPEDVRRRLVDMGDVLDMPSVTVRARGEQLIASGGSLRRPELKTDCPVSEGWVQLKSERGDLLALGQVRRADAELQVVPKRVFSDQK
jgi:tRNA pseudouridine55 synthase